MRPVRLSHLRLLSVAIALGACGDGGPTPTDQDGSAVVDTDLGVVVDPPDLGLGSLGPCGDPLHPNELACTGLYSDFASRTLAPGVREFKPGYELWSDGAEKTRWIALPPGSTIDVSNMDEWTFPVGTKLWKEFRVDRGAGRPEPVETRFLFKTGPTTWLRAVYLWAADGSSAHELVDGTTVAGTNGYEVPAQALCGSCHDGRRDGVLGFEAVLLASSRATGLTYEVLQRDQLLSSTNGRHTLAAAALAIPGSAVESEALGVLHSRCGVSCHNPNNTSSRFEMRLQLDARSSLPGISATAAVSSAVNRRSAYRPPNPGTDIFYRIRPTDPTHSTIYRRMSVRDSATATGDQMPPIATRVVDAQGATAIRNWIESMTVANGYPAPDPITQPMTPADGGTTPPSCNGRSLRLVEIARGLVAPVFAGAPNGDPRTFIVGRDGAIRIVKNGALLPTPFLDVTNEVLFRGGDSEGGLLGLAFHPQYAQNGRFWIYFTSRPDGNVVLREHRRSAGNPDVADPTPVRVVLDRRHGAWNHVGGMIAFGPDGYLYAAVGDGATPPPNSPARVLTSYLGKILRIDADNPSVAPAGNFSGAGVEPLAWHRGLRNPWRFSFDRMTGDLYIGDVGQGAYEEVDVAARGLGQVDWGWDTLEASHCVAAGCAPVGTLPAIEHRHLDGFYVMTGGYVYRGATIPCLQGRYLYADYATGRIYSFVYQGGMAGDRRELTSELVSASTPVTRISSFGEDGAGELLIVDFSGGRVYRIDLQ